MITILIVEDSKSIRETVAIIFRELKVKVIEADNGNQAVQYLAVEKPNLVITDIIMPEMNGYELCRWMRKNPQTQDIPVLICSSKSEEFDRHWGMKQGADEYLTKPFKSAELISKVKVLLQRKR